MKLAILFSLLLLSLFSNASPVSDLPKNICFDGCNDYMKDLLAEFETVGVLPSAEPAVYSGDCHHLGIYNPNDTHHAVVLLDQKTTGWNFSTIFSFYAETNEFADWTVTTARKEMNPYWNDHGDITIGSNATRVIVSNDDGNPAYVYWLRQNPQTKDLLYITYAVGYVTSFCRLKQNTP